jgi:hypothetical protein
MGTPLPDDLLRLLAEDAIETQQWAMRQGFRRPQQIERVVKALRKRLDEPEGGPRESGRLDQSDGAPA